MRIWLLEWKKIVSAPVVLVLMLLFIAFNLYLILTMPQDRDELALLNTLVDQYGYQIDETMLAQWKADLDEEQLLLEEETGHSLAELELAGEAVRERWFEWIVQDAYYQAAVELEQGAESIAMDEIAEGEIMKYGLSGTAAETIRQQYGALAEREREAGEAGEQNTLFFYGEVYEMHAALFQTIFRSLLNESLILIVLMTGFLLTYEFENRTAFVTYTTKRGRRLQLDKLLVSLGASLLVTTILIGSTLAAYFLRFDYSGLWHVPISSQFNSESGMTYLSWWSLSFAEYLLASIVLVYLCQLLFTAFTAVLALFIRNSYLVFITFAIIFGAAVLLPGIVPTSSNLLFVTMFTPFTLILNPHIWWTGIGTLTIFSYYEQATILSWTIIVALASIFALKRFGKSNL
ncbi:hypothetical protein [Halalkalibacter oceani]|uniref:hypothetical protein n=1 Tax=Halalkalibacter oceani TaxID=1653776 RepID=UPI00339A4C9F